MTQRYFELTEDMNHPERWSLGDTLDAQGVAVGERLYLNAAPIRFDSPLRVPLLHPGHPLDYSLADGGDFPIVTETVARTLAAWAPSDIQLHSAQVDSRSEPYFLLNAARLVKCIDDAACTEVRYWKPEHGQPEKAGQYRAVYGLRIDPDSVGDAKVFRPWGYPVVLLVAEDVKEALERTGASGLEFREVTGPSSISDEERAYKRKCRALLEPPPAARRTAWKSLGTLDELAVAPKAICYEWPGHRQNWAIIHRAKERTLLVSEGLSDPFISKLEPSVGFGLELALETDQAELPLDSIEGSWPFALLERVSRQLVANEDVREKVKAGLVALEVAGTDMPTSLVTSAGSVGVLLGLESHSLPRQFPTPFGDVRLVTVKALLPAEMEYVSTHGSQGTNELARRFAETKEEHVCLASRRAAL